MRFAEEQFHTVGAVSQLYKLCEYYARHGGLCRVLLEGPAGTGKSRGALECIYWLMEQYPKVRCLLARKIKADLAETVLNTWEEDVLPEDSPLLDGRQRRTRDDYKYPNGSQILLRGFDNPQRVRSAEYDICLINEATEISIDDYEIAMSRLRNGKMPFHLMVLDTNPESPTHWLNQYANDGRLIRLLSRHEDNPKFFDHARNQYTAAGEAYVNGTLEALTGVRYDRLRRGLWVAAEGLIWPQFDPAVHVIPSTKVPRDKDNYNRYAFKWMLAGVDWGYRNPGVMSVYGVDHDNRIYRVEEHYRVEKTLDWWARQAERVVARWKDHSFRCFVCDSAEPDSIREFNDRLGPMRGRDVPRIAVEADKDLQTGFDQVRQRLLVEADGKPSIFFVHGAGDRDPELIDGRRPTCTEQEIPEYVFREYKDGQRAKEEPEQGLADHGCDALRYVAKYVWGRDLSDPVVIRKSKNLLSPIDELLDYDRDLKP